MSKYVFHEKTVKSTQILLKEVFKIKTTSNKQDQRGWKKCGKGCKICTYTLPNTDTTNTNKLQLNWAKLSSNWDWVT